MQKDSVRQYENREGYPCDAIQQVSRLIEQVTGMCMETSTDSRSFHSQEQGVSIVSIEGQLDDEDRIITVRVELLRTDIAVRVAADPFFQHLSSLESRARLIAPVKDTSTGKTSLLVGLQVQAIPMGPARTSAFLDEVKRLIHLSDALRADLPPVIDDADLVKQYEDVSDVFEPIFPWNDTSIPLPGGWEDWTAETLDYLSGSSSIALVCPYPAEERFALATLAYEYLKRKLSLGFLKMTIINAAGLLKLLEKAPGTIVVQATRLILGTNRYDAESEIPALLDTLSDCNTPVIFTGTYAELQSLFHGGQGGQSCPVNPVVRRIPGVPLTLLTAFELHRAGRQIGGVPPAVQEALRAHLQDILGSHSPVEQRRILRSVATFATSRWDRSGDTEPEALVDFSGRVGRLTETMGGLSHSPRVSRPATIQDRFIQRLTDPSLFLFLQEHLLAQKGALQRLVDRLHMEVLTRPAYQPLRYAAQGTPGTGKSESAVLLARYLGIPYINIDAASMPDHHTATSMLLGSGRGIVGSHQSGRLEQIARHHEGAVVEISDLDHAHFSVRATLADLFLQVLETGEAQSAKGRTFSCASLIMAFTMNLPDGRDEAVRRGVGFTPPSDQEVQRRVESEIKLMLSGAFLSRVGSPILFEPLNGEALGLILERAIRTAVITAAERMHLGIGEVTVTTGTGALLLASMEANVTSSGARGLLEHGRNATAEAMLRLYGSTIDINGMDLQVSLSSDETLEIFPKR